MFEFKTFSGVIPPDPVNRGREKEGRRGEYPVFSNTRQFDVSRNKPGYCMA
jgi:hypothetical protein